MKWIVTTAVLFLIALGIGVGVYLISQQDSYVLIGYGNKVFTTNLPFAITTTAISLLLIGVLGYSLYILVTLSNRFGLWKKERRQKYAEVQTKKALIDLAEGDWAKAERQFTLAIANDGNALLGYLGAARAANALGLNDKRDDYLRLADENAQGADVAVGLTKAELQIDRGQYEQALATLMRLRTLVPEHSFVIKMMKQVYLELGDWEQLVLLAPEMRKYKVGSPKEANDLELQARLGLMKKVVKRKSDQTEESEQKALTNDLIRLWESSPKALQDKGELFSAYVKCLVQIGGEAHAEKELRSSISKHWNDELINLYGCIQGSDVSKQLIAAKSWLQERPNNETLLLTLGRLSLLNEQVDEAKHYFESSLSIRKSPEAYAELGRIQIAQGQVDVGNENLMLSLTMKNQMAPTLIGSNAKLPFKKNSVGSAASQSNSISAEIV